MKTIYIHTVHDYIVKKYIEKHKINIEDESHIVFNEKNKLSIFEITFSEKIMTFLIDILEEIMLLYNPILENDKIKNAVVENVFIPNRKKTMSDLHEYIQKYQIVNVEGYYKFRMENHNAQMHTMLYGIIKKHLDI